MRRAESLSPAWYEPHYQLGVLYEAEKKYSEAMHEMQEAVKIDPEFVPAHYRLAVLYNRAGRRSDAAAEALIVKQLKERDNIDSAVHDVTN